MASGAFYVARQQNCLPALLVAGKPSRGEENVCRHKGTYGISNVTVDARKALWKHSFSFRTRKDERQKGERHESIFHYIRDCRNRPDLLPLALLVDGSRGAGNILRRVYRILVRSIKESTANRD